MQSHRATSLPDCGRGQRGSCGWRCASTLAASVSMWWIGPSWWV